MSHISAFSIQNCITRAFLILMSSLFLLYPGTQGFGEIAQAKYQMFLLLCGGYTALMLLLLAESALVSGKKCRNLKAVLKETNWTQRFLALYLLFTWLSALLSPYFPETVIGVSRYEGALTISIYVVCFFLVRAYGRIDRVLITVFGAAVTLFDLLCIAQLYGGNPFTLYPVGYGYADAGVAYSGAYLGTIGNVDLVAAFFCLAIPAFWAAMLRSRDWQRWLLSVPLALSLFVLVKMNVLAGFVGVFAGGAISYVVIAPVGETHRRALAAAFFALWWDRLQRCIALTSAGCSTNCTVSCTERFPLHSARGGSTSGSRSSVPCRSIFCLAPDPTPCSTAGWKPLPAMMNHSAAPSSGAST